MANKANKKTAKPTKKSKVWADYGNLIIFGIVFVSVCIVAVGAILLGLYFENSASGKQNLDNLGSGGQNLENISSGTPNYNIFTGLEQLEKPAVGEEIAVLETTLGTIKIRLFPENAPKTVENFKGLISQGYYDGIIFHRVIKDFMIQGGDPTGTGAGGQSLWGTAFEDEFRRGLYNFRGAISMANSGSNTNGSQFFIVHSSTADESSLANLKNSGISDDVLNKYREIGGTPHLDGGMANDPTYGHTVFGQVFEGLDIVDALANVEVVADSQGSLSSPKEEIKIIKATLAEYQG